MSFDAKPVEIMAKTKIIKIIHLLDSETKLLITLYPEESYLMLPTPTIEE